MYPQDAHTQTHTPTHSKNKGPHRVLGCGCSSVNRTLALHAWSPASGQQNSCLVCTEPCIWFSAPYILGVLVHAYNPRTQAVDGGGRVVLQEPQESKAHLWLRREFETNLEYTKLYFKEQGAGSGGGELVIQFNGF